MKLAQVMLCCNDHRNGLFIGRLVAIELLGLSLAHDDFIDGCAVSFLGDNRIRISRRIFTYSGQREWVGNWCWNAITMVPLEAKRLLRYLRETGAWHCEEGPTRLFAWWHKSESAQQGVAL